MWYAAHAVMLISFKDEAIIQNEFPVWENIFLIEAKDGDEAYRQAAKRAQEDEKNQSDTFTYEDKPSKFVFIGFRKLMQCMSDEEQPSNGTEVSHNQLSFQSKTDLEAYVRGEEVTVKFNDENPYEPDNDQIFL